MLTLSQSSYLLIIGLMLTGIYIMATDQEKIPQMSKWTRVVDSILMALLVRTAIVDYLHRYDKNVTVLNGILFAMSILSIVFHEEIRDLRVAKLLEAQAQTQREEKRGLGEAPVSTNAN